MGYTAGFTAVTGATYTAAQYNTNVRDNFTAIWVFTTAGDLIYATGANTAARLALGTAGQQLRVNAGATAPEWATIDAFPAGGSAYQGVRQNSAASAKEWAALISLLRRQGGSASDWDSQGTTDYTPAAGIAQMGSLTISMSGTPMSGSGSVTFPVAFSAKPLVFVTTDVMVSSGVWLQFGHYNVTASGFGVYCSYNANSTYGNRTISWLAIGPP